MTMAGRRLQEFIGDVMLSHAFRPDPTMNFFSKVPRLLGRQAGVARTSNA